jgi:hypothetical protein
MTRSFVRSATLLLIRRRSLEVAYLTRSKGFLKLVCSLLLFSVLAADPLCAAASPAASSLLTNFDILKRVSTEAASEIVSAIGPYAQGEIILVGKSKSLGSVDFLLENAFVQEMRDAGLRVAADVPAKDGAAPQGRYRLSYQIIRLSLSYPRISRKWLLGPREVEREARADVFAQFTDLSTGDILWTKESHKTYTDRIGYARLASVEDAQYDFTRPPHSEFKMSRLFEPIIVGGIVAGLVYLFFSNQSNK